MRILSAHGSMTITRRRRTTGQRERLINRFVARPYRFGTYPARPRMTEAQYLRSRRSRPIGYFRQGLDEWYRGGVRIA